MKKQILVIAFLVMFVILAVSLRWWCFSGAPSECSFSRIKPGMSLETVQSILGQGKEIAWNQLPQVPLYAARIVDGRSTTRVVEGDRFFMWHVNDGSFYVSFKDDKVFEKYYAFLPIS